MRNTVRLITALMLLTLSVSAQWRPQPYYMRYHGVKNDSLFIPPKITALPSLIEDGAIRYADGSWQGYKAGWLNFSIKRTLHSIPQLYTLKGETGDISFVTDTFRGGLFVYTTSTPTSDSGIIFPASTGRWVRLYNSGEVQADWWEDSRDNPAIRKAIAALPAGGTVRLSNQAYFSPAPTDAVAITTRGISLVGESVPGVKLDQTQLEGGSRIIGPMFVYTSDFSMSNIGIDAGKTVTDAYYGGIGQDVFQLFIPANPTQLHPSPVSTNITINNVVGIARDQTSGNHVFLFENAAGVRINGLTAVFGLYGLAIKAQDVQADNIACYSAGGNGLIIKSDSVDTYAPCNNVQIGSYRYASRVPGATPYVTIDRPVSALHLQSRRKFLYGVSIGSIIADSTEFGISANMDPGDGKIERISIGDVQLSRTSDAAIYLSGQADIQIGNVSIQNTAVGFLVGPAGRLYVSQLFADTVGALFNVDPAADVTVLSRSMNAVSSPAPGNATVYFDKSGSTEALTVKGSAELTPTAASGYPLNLLNRNKTRRYGLASDAFVIDDGIFNITDRTASAVRLSIEPGGKVGIGHITATSQLDINGANGYNQFRLRTQYTPTSSADSNGNAGDIAVDDNYFYFKTSTGWKRAALSTW